MPDKKSRVRRLFDAAKQVAAQLPKLKNPALVAGRFALSKSYTVALYGLQIISTAPAVLLSINHYSATRSWFYKLGYTVCTDVLPILALEAARQVSWSYFNQQEAPVSDDFYYQQAYHCLDANLTGIPHSDAIQAFLLDQNMSLCMPESTAYSNIGQEDYSHLQWLPESFNEPLSSASTALAGVTQWLPDDPATALLGTDTWARHLTDTTTSAIRYCITQLASATHDLIFYKAPSLPITIAQLYFLTELTVRLLTLKLQHYPAIYAPLHPEQTHNMHAGKKIDHRHPVCISNNCSNMRYAKGELRSFLVWVLLSVTLSLYGTHDRHGLGPIIPILSWMCQFLLDGELILEFRLGDEGMCDRHRMDVYKEHSELSFSLGMFQSLSTWALTHMVTHFTGIESGAFNTCISGVMGALFLCVSYHIPITPRNDHHNGAAADDPAPKRWATPTSVFRNRFIDFTMRLTTSGAKEEMKKLAVDLQARQKQKKKRASATKHTASGAARAQGNIGYDYDLVWAIKQYRIHKDKLINLLDFAPPLMRNLSNFADDPVCGTYALALAERIQECIREFRQASSKFGVQILRIAPTPAAVRIVSSALNVPKPMAKIIIDILKSGDIRWALNTTEERLKALLNTDCADIDISDLVVLDAPKPGQTQQQIDASAFRVQAQRKPAVSRTSSRSAIKAQSAARTQRQERPQRTDTLRVLDQPRRRGPATPVRPSETDSEDSFVDLGAFGDFHELPGGPKDEPDDIPRRQHYQGPPRTRF